MAATTTTSSSCNGFFSPRSTNSGDSRVKGCGKPDGVAMWFINGVTTAFFASLEHCCIRIATQEDAEENSNDDLPLILNDGNLRHRHSSTTTPRRKPKAKKS
ncbi:hypothetical protein VNO77_32453 [Canavalia gladiata]|uniref:Uncharacterized protein n=1 Tax=Canavalia gladiata TaxID=3824 RepID=A0AAN9KQ43_CANGL